MASPTRQEELMANMTGMFRALTVDEQDRWLRENNLTRLVAAPVADMLTFTSPQKRLKSTSPQSGVSPVPPPVGASAGALVPSGPSATPSAQPYTPRGTSSLPPGPLSPSRQQFEETRLARKHEEALRLSLRVPKEELDGLPPINVANSKYTEPELRAWFNDLDTNKNGWLSYSEFRQFYVQQEHFGAPVPKKKIDELLAKMHAFDDDRLSFDEFAYLVLHLAKR
jgi:hypothetical protein